MNPSENPTLLIFSSGRITNLYSFGMDIYQFPRSINMNTQIESVVSKWPELIGSRVSNHHQPEFYENFPNNNLYRRLTGAPVWIKQEHLVAEAKLPKDAMLIEYVWGEPEVCGPANPTKYRITTFLNVEDESQNPRRLIIGYISTNKWEKSSAQARLKIAQDFVYLPKSIRKVIKKKEEEFFRQLQPYILSPAALEM